MVDPLVSNTVFSYNQGFVSNWFSCFLLLQCYKLFALTARLFGINDIF